jgi:LmbE family N-acetylglucosaminyl deacetylase
MSSRPHRVVVSAHLDDAVLSAARALGRRTLVVTVFAGIPAAGVVGSWDADCGWDDSRQAMTDRRREDVAALAHFGAPHLHVDVLGGQHVRRCRRDGSLLARIASTLAPLMSGAARVYGPAGIGHPEHVQVRDAVLSVRPAATLYADLPYAAAGAIASLELPRPLRTTHSVRTATVLRPGEWRRKRDAVRCYTSQLELLEQAFGPFLTPGTLGTEVYWSAPAQGRAAPGAPGRISATISGRHSTDRNSASSCSQ